MRSPTPAPFLLAALVLSAASARGEEPASAPPAATAAQEAAPASTEQATDGSAGEPNAPTAAPEQKAASDTATAPAPSPAAPGGGAEATPSAAEETPSAAKETLSAAEETPSAAKETLSAAEETPSAAKEPPSGTSAGQERREELSPEKPVEAKAAAPTSRPQVAPIQAVSSAPAAPQPAPAPPDMSQAKNEVALQVGWNAPAGTGGHYLRRIDETHLSVGLGFALRTLWGPKVALLARYAERVDRGLFFQGSAGFSLGQDGVKVPVNGTEEATFRFTPGRTLDAVAGYRWPLGTTFFEAMCGYSFNLQGTALQTTRLKLDDISRTTLGIMAPGGGIVAVSYGLLF